MVEITYTALRKLKTGHIAGTDYVIEIELTRFTETPSPLQAENKTLTGSEYVDLFNIEELYAITTCRVPISGTGIILADLREFLYSIMGGYTFTLVDGDDTYVMMLKGRPSITKKDIHAQVSFNVKVI